MARDFQMGKVDIYNKASVQAYLWGRIQDAPSQINCVYYSNQENWILIYERYINSSNQYDGYIWWDNTNATDTTGYVYQVNGTTGAVLDPTDPFYE
jgi:hypothetical protein